MSKFLCDNIHYLTSAFQIALDELDVIGSWTWDAATDRIRVDAVVALLFNLDPDQAAEGLPLTCFIQSIHGCEQERIAALFCGCAREGGAYLVEHRVKSVDGQMRWVLARGRFTRDHVGRPQSGRGILVDVTQLRMNEGALEAEELCLAEEQLERAAEHAITAQEAIADLKDPELKACADALLMALGRKLAQRERREWRRHMN
ncbi:PAS domain-containing protein [Methylobacterium sp. 275MFSha3.1]|uniref:PAS domain-containing protein n=1 Tax=Methylobacterium sp. 275MFSha3.1 TaxID=1502746 RepID=UPI001FCDBBE7|nr:PAS domain-containing protein [Methylobacterium sp. 275MFSha3.1]